MVLLSTDKAQRISDVQQSSPQVVNTPNPASDSTPTYENVTTTKTVNGYDYQYDKLQDKLYRVEEKISRYKDKLRSGKSNEQDRIQYQRYVMLREDIQGELNKLREYKKRALTNKNIGVEKTNQATTTPTNTVQVGATTLRNVQTENIQGGGTYAYVNIDDVQVTGKNDYGRTTQTVSIKEQEQQGKAQAVKDFNPQSFTVKRTVSGQESISPKAYESNLRSEVQAQAEVKQERAENYTNKVESLRTKGQQDYTNTLKGAGYLTLYTGVKVIEGGVKAVQVISPVDFQGNAQIPVVTPTYKFGKYLVTGEYIEDIKKNPLGFSAEFLGATAVLTKTPIKDVASKQVEIITYPIRNSPKFTSAEIKGGTEQYLKYGDNRINKQFKDVITQKETQYKITIVEPRTSPEIKSIETQQNLYNENYLTLRNREQTQSTKDILQSKIKEIKPKVVQKTLDNKNAYDGLKQPEDLIVKDVTESTQQQIKVVDVINIDETGKITTGTDIKLKPAEKEGIRESTSRLSTQVEKKQATRELDTLGEGVGKNQEMFNYKTEKQKMQEIRSYNQELVLLEQEATTTRQGRVVKITEQDLKNIPLTNERALEPWETTQPVPLIVKTLSPQTKTVQIQQPTSLFKQDTKTDLKIDTQVKQDTKIDTKINTDTKQDLNLRARTKIVQEQVPIQRTEQRQEQVPIQRIETKQNIISLTSSRVIQQVVTPPTNKPTPPPEFRNKMFITQVKAQGKFKTIGTFESMSEAFNRGRQYVEQTASATFKITTNGQSVKPKGFLPRGFTTSKSVTGGIVQERKNRISSQGEKIEISAKGRRVQQARGLFKKRRGVFL